MSEFETVKSYYSRPEVKRAILEVSKDREVVTVFRNGSFGQRPNILQYPADIDQSVKEGAVSFHGSVERWDNPMNLKSGMLKEMLDRMRKGWDILIDLDVPDFDIAKMTAAHILKALKDHGVSSTSIKFTGGKSFHIGVPFESLPKSINMRPTGEMYPDAAKKIMEYLKWYTNEPLRDAFMDIDDPGGIAERIGKPLPEIISEEGIEPFKVVDMDIFGSRHMFRLPYSLHEKSLLVSMPIRVEDLDNFEKSMAEPESVKVDVKFLERKVERSDGHALVMEAFDWASKYMKEDERVFSKEQTRKKRMMKVAEEDFPPCVKKILKGVSDGRKRSIFILINFLGNMGWKPDEIEERLYKWNDNNYPPVRVNYIRSQLRWHESQSRELLPPNCNNKNFYCSFGACEPDPICTQGSRVAEGAKVEPCSPSITIKNPVNYAFRKMKREGRFRAKKRKGGK